VEVCIDYSGITVANESKLKLFHRENNAWVDRTSSLDTQNDIICAEVTSFSLFVIFEFENQGPIALCQDVTVSADGNCQANVTAQQVDNGSSDPDGEPISLSLSPPGPYPLGDTQVTLSVSDGEDANTCTATVTVVDDTPPAIVSISVPVSPLQVDTPITSFSATFTDLCDSGEHTATWDFGDGNIASGIVNQNTNTVTVTISHAYDVAGVYTVSLSLTDPIGVAGSNSAKDTAPTFVVIYDPSAGFVTGGGWIDSPTGAYVPDASLTGKANFGFVSKYKKGKSVPSGQTQFQFKTADFNFHSGTYEWLVITNHKAMYKGTGTINNAGNYGFQLTAIDADLTPSTDTDLFRIRIWDKDNNDALVYDNQVDETDPNADPTTEIGGGSIKIQSSGVNKTATAESQDLAELAVIPESFALWQNYPNPFNPSTTISFDVPKTSNVTIMIYDVIGRQVATLIDDEYQPGHYKVVFEAGQLATGLYIYRIQAGDFHETKKLLLLK